jgi:CRP-like cAMP-binding protein
MDRENFLASVPLFAGLTPSEFEDMMRLAEPFSFEPGHLVFAQGMQADGMYLLERGKIQLWARLLGEDEIALAQIGSGGVLGEFSLIDRGPRSASAEVIELAQGYFFGNRHFERLRADRRPATLKMMRQLRSVLCQRLRAAFAQLGASPPAFYEHTQSLSGPLSRAAPKPSANAVAPGRLRLLPFFSAFSDGEIAALLERSTVMDLLRGHMLGSEGDEGRSMFVTIRGAVEVTVGSELGRRRLAIVGPGKLCGQIAALDGGKREAGLAVRENAVILEIPGSIVGELLAADSGLGFKFSNAIHATLIDSLRAANRTLLNHSAMGRDARRKKRTPSLLPC